MLLPPTCLPVCLPVSPSFLSVSETSMDDSGHKENTEQIFNSRVLGVLQATTLTMTQVSVSQSPSKLFQNHLTHVLIQLSVIASNRCVKGL